MKVILNRVGLKTSLKENTIPLKISGVLKSRISTRNFVRIRLDNGEEFRTGTVRRCGPGFILTDEADYAVTITSAAPPTPPVFKCSLHSLFSNEREIATAAIDLADHGEVLHDTPLQRELGYPEAISKTLGFELNSHADGATEGAYPVQNAQRVIIARLSAQAADALERLHDIDYRARVVALRTRHVVRGIETPEQELTVISIFTGGRVIHCLPDELPIDQEELLAHELVINSLVASANGEGEIQFKRRRRAAPQSCDAEKEAA